MQPGSLDIWRSHRELASSLPELPKDRVLVMRGGKVAADLSGEDLTETRIVLEGYGFGIEEEQ